jgi:hypothetical protein
MKYFSCLHLKLGCLGFFQLDKILRVPTNDFLKFIPIQCYLVEKRLPGEGPTLRIQAASLDTPELQRSTDGGLTEV